MPLYYFDLHDGDGVAPDEEGTELSSIDEVQNEAAYALADLLRDEVRATNGYPHARYLIIEVRDADGPGCALGSRSNSSVCSKAPQLARPILAAAQCGRTSALRLPHAVQINRGSLHCTPGSPRIAQ